MIWVFDSTFQNVLLYEITDTLMLLLCSVKLSATHFKSHFLMEKWCQVVSCRFRVLVLTDILCCFVLEAISPISFTLFMYFDIIY